MSEHESEWPQASALSRSIWLAGAFAFLGFLLVAAFFAWAVRHDSGDEAGVPYVLVGGHIPVAGCVAVLLIRAWLKRRAGRLNRTHALPLVLALIYLSLALVYLALVLFALIGSSL